MAYNKDDKKYSSQQIMNRVFDEDGNFLSVSDYGFSIANGSIPGAGYINKFGACNAGAEEIAVWDGATTYTFPATAGTVTITSDSPDDVNGGTGAWSISIQGLDANYNVITEDVLLGATTTQSFLRVYRMIIKDSGSAGTNVGNVSATLGATVVAKILANQGQTLMAVYTVPAGKTAYLTYLKTSTGKGKDVIARLKTRPLGGSFNIKHIAYVYEANYDYCFTAPLVFAEKTDILVTAQADVSNSNVSATFDVILIDN